MTSGRQQWKSVPRGEDTGDQLESSHPKRHSTGAVARSQLYEIPSGPAARLTLRTQSKCPGLDCNAAGRIPLDQTEEGSVTRNCSVQQRGNLAWSLVPTGHVEAGPALALHPVVACTDAGPVSALPPEEPPRGRI